MRQPFKKKLESMVRRTRDGHWILDPSKRLVRVPGRGTELFTTKRAVYAVYVGPIPENVDVRTTCDVPLCVAPRHTSLEPTRRESRALDLSEFMDEFSPGLEAASTTEVSEAVAAKVKFMATRNPLKDICFATGLSARDVMRIKAGKYRVKKENKPGDFPEWVGLGSGKRAELEASMSEEEKAWVNSVT